ncbi:MAG: hypothetical protein ACI9KE_000129 [Polyangiales bacterium]|jgi:uncharacterized protein (TIGR02231 family)
MSEDSRTIECPILKVTVLEERALIEREASITLTTGVQKLRIEGVAPALIDKTLVVKVGTARVLDARVRRFRVHRNEEQPARVQELLDVERGAAGKSEEANATLDASREDLRYWEEASARSAVEAGEDVAWGRESSSTWLATFDEIAERLSALYEAIARGVQIANDAVEVLSDIRVQLRDARRTSSEECAWLELRIMSEVAGDLQLDISYAVPGACWRPQHRARWQGSVVHFETQASVWQRTGEDWSNVELEVSTERASLGVDPPELATDELRVRKKAPGTQVAMREEEVESAGAARLASELPGIDDGGDALLLKAPSKATVRADGRPHRIALSSFTAPAEAHLFVVGELESTVQQKTTLNNESPRPVLAGPVDLIRESGPVGQTKTLFVAPGEQFDLGWGPENDLRVTRECTNLDPKRSMLSGWTHKTKKVQLKLSNIGRSTHHLEVIERVPVSELESVEIKVDGADSKQPDQDGFVRWLDTLQAGERRTFTLTYTVSTKRDVSGI